MSTKADNCGRRTEGFLGVLQERDGLRAQLREAEARVRELEAFIHEKDVAFGRGR